MAYYLLHGAPAALRAALRLSGPAGAAPPAPTSPGRPTAAAGEGALGLPGGWRYVRPPPLYLP